MNVRRLIVTVSAGLVTLAAPLAPTATADPFIPSGSAGTGSSGIDDLIGATGSSGLAQTGSAGGRTFRNCDEARAAGRAPLFRGEPGYSPHLDPDGTGMACPTV
ncbi:excalibur calcium-binding domain-containing protein [Nocardia sp. CDC159]|uniref:Excalibur calcium-binding domain-containing protein n=1 Tax=Nocardia pulmonis TaxID=2951408 RepID=A0A9X2J2P4_9NOCA|nr:MULTISPECIES: excalibur calcium-binding domain-containing protein [Nocardia]MCM6778256.1 excalibur calcium-binding domain-containing protein [Nocardia pulmonis]MCM6791145.1 excalibur calcium-binding domain-containing protein [Nocardia sp. CDC159]